MDLLIWPNQILVMFDFGFELHMPQCFIKPTFSVWLGRFDNSFSYRLYILFNEDSIFYNWNKFCFDWNLEGFDLNYTSCYVWYFTANRRFQATTWIKSMVGSLDMPCEPSEEFCLCLRSGIILCNLINKVQPGAMSKVGYHLCPLECSHIWWNLLLSWNRACLFLPW